MDLLKIFLEARTNNFQKTSIYDIIQEYTTRYNADDYFITFTSMNKIGINPSTPWGTPLGVYCYPLKASWENYYGDKYPRPMELIFPFAGDMPFITIFELKDKSKIMYTNKYTNSQYENDCIFLKSYITKYKTNKTFEQIKQISENECNKEYRTDNFNLFYVLTKNLSEAIVTYREKQTNTIRAKYDKQKHGSVDEFKKKYNSLPHRHLALWNFFIRKCGYDCLIDDEGKSHIDLHEPTQALILNSSNIYNKIMFPNNFNVSNLDLSELIDSTFEIHSFDKNKILQNIDKYSWLNEIQNLSNELIPLKLDYRGNVTLGNKLDESKIKFTNLKVDNVTFINCIIEDSSSIGFIKSNITFSYCIMNNLNINYSTIFDSTIKQSNIKNSSIVKSNLINSSIEKCKFEMSTFIGNESDIINCNIINSNLN